MALPVSLLSRHSPAEMLPASALDRRESSAIDFRQIAGEYSQIITAQQQVLKELKQRNWHKKINSPNCLLISEIQFEEFAKNLNLIEANLDRWMRENLELSSSQLEEGYTASAILPPYLTGLSRPLLIRQLEGKKEAYLLFICPIDKKVQGMAKSIFLAYDAINHKPKAVLISKTITPLAVSAKSDSYEEALFFQRLENHLRHSSQRQPVFTLFHHSQCSAYYIIEKRYNMDLFDLILSENPAFHPFILTIKNRRIILENVLTQLADLHKQGLVHRDIKMENILVKISGLKVKAAALIDWDFVCPNYLPGNPQGTISYLAPEMVKAILEDDSTKLCAATNTKTDIWSLSYVLFFIFKDILDKEDPEFSQILLHTYTSLEKIENGQVTDTILSSIYQEMENLKIIPLPKTTIGKLIIRMRNPDPVKRPDVEEILKEALKQLEEMRET